MNRPQCEHVWTTITTRALSLRAERGRCQTVVLLFTRLGSEPEFMNFGYNLDEATVKRASEAVRERIRELSPLLVAFISETETIEFSEDAIRAAHGDNWHVVLSDWDMKDLERAGFGKVQLALQVTVESAHGTYGTIFPFRVVGDTTEWLDSNPPSWGITSGPFSFGDLLTHQVNQ